MREGSMGMRSRAVATASSVTWMRLETSRSLPQLAGEMMARLRASAASKRVCGGLPSGVAETQRRRPRGGRAGLASKGGMRGRRRKSCSAPRSRFAGVRVVGRRPLSRSPSPSRSRVGGLGAGGVWAVRGGGGGGGGGGGVGGGGGGGSFHRVDRARGRVAGRSRGAGRRWKRECA